ncbi:MAG: ABC transporter ATP-binding protein [Acidimicrobiia bacterium]
MTALLEMIDVGRNFGAVEAVRSASLRIDRGDSVAVVGRSGSGKSSLLRIMGLLDRPTHGSHTWLGVDVGRTSEKSRAATRASSIGFVFQDSLMLPGRSVVENIDLGLAHGRIPFAQRGAAIKFAVCAVGLQLRSDALIETLSGGELQRAALARAVAHGPVLLLCDEPSGNLDTDSAEQVGRLLVNLAELGTAVVIATHDLTLAGLAQRQYQMRDGCLIGSR